jgi:UDP-N-acetylenolpyruvoylglucosamine reductase
VLARKTTLRVGGPADIYAEPGSEADLSLLLRYCTERRLPWLVLGRGSNLLVKDNGFRGVVISLARPPFTAIEVVGHRLRCGAGARLKDVAAAAKASSLEGLEFLEGIPGTVGGALRMNAGAMGSEIFNVVESVRVMDPSGQEHQLGQAELKPSYRSCGFLKSHIALGALLCGVPGSRNVIEQRMNEYSRRRWSSQPAAPSAGCMFKNPASIPAGKLIDELGLKGTRVGGARVSLEHGNFIVNDGQATAADILNLIDVIRDRVRKDRGIELEPEVQVVGE